MDEHNGKRSYRINWAECRKSKVSHKREIKRNDNGITLPIFAILFSRPVHMPHKSEPAKICTYLQIKPHSRKCSKLRAFASNEYAFSRITCTFLVFPLCHLRRLTFNNLFVFMRFTNWHYLMLPVTDESSTYVCGVRRLAQDNVIRFRWVRVCLRRYDLSNKYRQQRASHTKILSQNLQMLDKFFSEFWQNGAISL